MAGCWETVSDLPFFDLSHREFNAMFGSWSDWYNDDSDLHDFFSNSDKFDECDPDLMLTTPCSEYYSVHDINKMQAKSNTKSFSILHCNTRSLTKNLNLLEELMYSFDFKLDIIAITETKLREQSIINVDFKDYNFFTLTFQQMLEEQLSINYS